MTTELNAPARTEETGLHTVGHDEHGEIKVEILGTQPPVGTNMVIAGSDKWALPGPLAETPIGVLQPITPDHAVRTHHKYGMSKLGYLHACPGFTSTDGSSEAAEQGTRLHEIMDLLIERYKAEKRPLLDLLSDFCKDNALDDDERFLLVYCIRILDEWITSAKEIVNEIRVFIINPDGSELNHGHLDLLFIFNETALLIDYKFGWLPVPPAPSNLQGRGYALGVFSKFPRLQKIAVMFIQPKISLVSKTIFNRSEVPEMYRSIKETIDRAELVQRDPAGTEAMLNPSDYCNYCALAREGRCPAKIKQLRSTAAALRPGLDFQAFDVDRIDTPERAAKVRYAIEMMESGDFLEAIKTRCREMAIANGGQISFEGPDGTITYGIEQRKHDRTLGDTLEIATTLKDQGVLTFEEVLSCADLALGKLETVGTNALFDKAKAELDAQLTQKTAELAPLVAAKKMTKTQMQKALAEVKAEFKATKKEATEHFQKLLENQGLLSRPEGTIPVLRRKKNESPKQIAA